MVVSQQFQYFNDKDGEIDIDTFKEVGEKLGFNKSESLFVTWINKAQKDKKITSQLADEEIATQFHSILKGQIFWPVLMGLEKKENLDLKKISDSTVSFFMNSFCHKD